MDHTNMKDINIEEYKYTHQKLKIFFENYFSIKISELNDEQTLDDFGVDADDMYELLIKLSNEFNFDLNNFNKDRYISAEPTLLTFFYSIINFIFKTDYAENCVEPITIRMIVLSILNKLWLY